MAADGLVDAGRQGFHFGPRLVRHQVEAERVDAILGRPQQDRIAHQLCHHPVFGGGVFAAGGTFDRALGVKAVVITRHGPIEHGLVLLPGGAGVVVDHVHAHAQAVAVQGLHHLPELADACGAITRIRGEAALGRIEMQRVVAPVETIGRRNRHHCRLLRFTRGAVIGYGGCLAADLRHAGQVEYRQQVHVGHAGLGQRLQMPATLRIRQCEGAVLAAHRFGHGQIIDRKIADMQFVYHHVGLRQAGMRRARLIPAVWLERRRIGIGDIASLRVGVQADRIRIGHAIAYQADTRYHHVHQILVVLAGQVARHRVSPDAGAGIGLH